MSHRKSFIAAAIASAAAAVVLPIAALADSSDSVSGIEIYATNTQGVFTGAAGGSLPGVWSATVVHTPLAGSPLQHAKITGGSFDVVSGLTIVSGSFNGGSVDQTSGSSGCVNQIYHVNGGLTNVGKLGQTHTGSGTFNAYLTHYRTSFFGHCLTYGASIRGTVTFSF